MIERQSLPARIILTLFLAPFLLATAMTAASPVVIAARSAWMAAYRAVPCVVEASAVRERDGRYYLDVRYAYEAGGRTQHGTVYQRGDAGSESRGVIEAVADRYGAGERATCFVSPLDPATAVLRRGQAGVTALGLFVPLVAGIALFVPLALTMVLVHAPERLALLRSDPFALARLIPLILGVVCLAAGILLTHLMLVAPAWRALQARSWRPTACTITRSRLVASTETTREQDPQGRSRDVTRTVYGFDLAYRYKVDDREYVGHRHRFFDGSAGRERNQAIVDRYPEGGSAVCYVDPRDPEAVVLDRAVGTEVLWGLVPLAMLAVGTGALIVGRRAFDRSPGARAAPTSRPSSAT